jgi:hypothetical protein
MIRSRRLLRKKNIEDYVHSGGFNRLAGKSTIPGSVRPEDAKRRWRIFLLVIIIIFFSLGFLSLIGLI